MVGRQFVNGFLEGFGDDSDPGIVGHRGWPSRFPDNTLPGLIAASEVADAVEVDVRRCGDGRLVLSHDPVIAGLPVASTGWATLAELDLGAGHHPVLLDEAMAAIPGTPVMLEIKNLPDEPGFEPDHRVALETAERAREGDILTSFHWPTVDAVRRSFPDVATGLIVPEEGSLGEAAAHCRDRGHLAIAAAQRLLVAGALVAELGIPVHVWTVNDPALARELVALGASGIITDDPGLIASIREPR